MNFSRQETDYIVLTIVNDGHNIGGNDAETAPRSRVTMPEPLTDTVAMACDTL